MAAQRTIYRVLPTGDRWVVKVDGERVARAECFTREMAEAAARARAHSRPPSELIVHRRDGSIEYTATYESPARAGAGTARHSDK